jgi:CRP-like cAMP-binding protein
MKSQSPGSVQEHEAEFGRLKNQMGSHPFLKGMAPEDLSTLALYAMRTEFTPGQLIFRQGDIANRFYLILNGTVALEALAQDRQPVVIQTIGAGEVLGWSWLFQPYTWRFDARAVEPVQAIFFYGTRLREHCEEDLRFGHEVMRRVAEVAVRRLNAIRARLLELSALPAS